MSTCFDLDISIHHDKVCFSNASCAVFDAIHIHAQYNQRINALFLPSICHIIYVLTSNGDS